MAESKKETKYFRSVEAAGLTVKCKDGTKVRFTPYFDTYKGDKVRVGYLETDNEEVVERLQSVGGVEEVKKAEFDKDTKDLVKAPVYSV